MGMKWHQFKKKKKSDIPRWTVWYISLFTWMRLWSCSDIRFISVLLSVRSTVNMEKHADNSAYTVATRRPVTTSLIHALCTSRVLALIGQWLSLWEVVGAVGGCWYGVIWHLGGVRCIYKLRQMARWENFKWRFSFLLCGACRSVGQQPA